VWMAPSLQGKSRRIGGVVACTRVSGLRRGAWPLALMGVRGLGPHRSRGFEDPGYVPGCSQLVGTAAHSITPVLLASILAPAALAHAAAAAAGW
jgi:hypothetical protein